MRQPKDPHSLELVRKAIQRARTFVQGCCDWSAKAHQRVLADKSMNGMTPEGIKVLLLKYVLDDGGEIIQVPEKNLDYAVDHPFYYKVILPCPVFRSGIFVEMLLVEEDPDYPGVLIVSAHEQQ